MGLLEHLFAGGTPKPNLIACTGDIAYGQTGAQPLALQYVAATTFFNDLLARCGLSADRLFIVPGNHDVNRSAVNKLAETQYRQMAKEWRKHERIVNENLANSALEYTQAMARLKEYLAFFKTICPHITTVNEHANYVCSTLVNGLEIQIIGLNSAWACNGTEDHRSVWVAAEAQLANVVHDQSFRIGLIHHPLEWITKADSTVLEGRLGKDIHVLLHGHEHEFREHVFSGYPVIGSGAVTADEDAEYGIVLCELDTDSGALVRRPYEYSSRDRAWVLKSRSIPAFNFEAGASFAKKLSAGRILKPESTYGASFVRPGRMGGNGESDEYEDPVEPPSTVHIRDAEYFKHLWTDTMGDHTISDKAGDPNMLHFDGLDSSTRIVQKDNLDAYFLRKVVEPISFDIAATANDDPKDQADARKTFEEFEKEITDPPKGAATVADHKNRSENRVRYLIGDAGIGKSLAVLKVLDRVGMNPERPNGFRLLPVYVDLHQDRVWTDHEPARAVDLTVVRVGLQLLDAVASEAVDTSTILMSSQLSGDELDRQFQLLASLLLKHKLAPFIVFDNGDRFFFENAKYRFFADFARKRDWHLDDTFVALVDRFVVKSSLGEIGACVLFVCRKYVYRHCGRLFDAADPLGLSRRDHKVYQVIAPSSDDVIASRFRLFTAAVTAVRSGYRNSPMFLDRVNALRTKILRMRENPVSAFGTIFELVHQGHRSLVQFLGTLPVDVGPGAEITDRLLNSPHILLRLYLTNMRKRYTQKTGHFPNVFLNDAVVDPSDAFAMAHAPHVHTYWLKYLLLRHAALQGRGRKKGRINSEETIRFFVDSLHYEEHLVRLALGSLSDPSAASCLQIIRPDRLRREIESLQLSSRGLRIVGGYDGTDSLSFSFDYLQLVTDDYLLALPTVVADDIFVDANLAHTLKEGHVYSRGARETLKKKIPAVLSFLSVLEITFREEAKYRGTERLLAELKMAPDFDAIACHVIAGINRVDQHFEPTYMAGDSLPDPEKYWNKVRNQARLVQHLSDYYRLPALVAV